VWIQNGQRQNQGIALVVQAHGTTTAADNKALVGLVGMLLQEGEQVPGILDRPRRDQLLEQRGLSCLPRPEHALDAG